jgi:hypothetical protein
LLDEVLDASALVELEQGGHLVAFLEQGIAFLAELGKCSTAFLKFLGQAGDALVGAGEFVGFLLELFFEGVELAALPGDH